jgi:NADP-dependent 3-hydroxy acid dehydrogenase YdfG
LGNDAAVQTDVTQYAQVKHLVNHAVHPMQRRRIWDRMIDVNLKGVLYGIAAALPYMKAQKGGHTVISPGAVATELPDSITNPTSQRTYASVTRSPFGTST